MINFIQATIQLAKMPLCLMVALSSLFCFIIYSPSYSSKCIALFSGIFLLACSAASLNSIQEIERDRCYNRTKNRPLVTGKISKAQATFLSCLFFLSGTTTLLLSFSSSLPAFLGVATLLTYNFIYTTLKSRTILAIFPGGIVGALPPLTGWIAAGGNIHDERIWIVMAIFFLWQIPHYFLLLLEHSEDYILNKENNILKTTSSKTVKRIILVWIISYCCTVIALTIVPDFLTSIPKWLLIMITCVVITFFISQLFNEKPTQFRRLFILLNTSLLTIMLIIGTGRFFYR